MRPFSKQQQTINETNISYYANIGLITIRFAELESIITHIIEYFINSDNEIISHVLIGNNNLESNLTLLKKINLNRRYEEEKINKIITEIRILKDTRNLFVHGVWSEVHVEDDETYILCSNHKQVYEKVHDGRQWRRYGSQKFTQENLEFEIKKIDIILLALKEILDNLSETDFN